MSSCQSCGTALATDTCFCQSCGSPTEIKVSARAVEGSADGAVMSPPGKTEPKMMDTNVVAALTYLAGFLTGIIFLALDPYKSNSFVRSFSRFPVNFRQCRMDRLLAYLADSLRGANTMDGRGLWPNCSAVDADIHPGRSWNLDLPDVPGLSTKTFQAADRRQIRCRARGGKGLIPAEHLSFLASAREWGN